jgi:hypothetical protein
MPQFDKIGLDDAAFAGAMLRDARIDVDVPAAYHRVLARARRRAQVSTQVAFGLAAAAVVALCFALLPIGSYGRDFLAIFEPREFVPIYLSNDDGKRLQNSPLSNLGKMHFVKSMSRVRMPSPASIAAAGFQPRLPSAGALNATPRYYYLPAGRVDFTFERTRAAAYAQRTGRQLPSMPASIDGTRLIARSGPGMVADFKRANGQMFTIVELRAPVVVSSGASMGEIERYVASLPGIPGDVAAQFKNLNSPSTMLPIPLRIDPNAASHVDVRGATALAFGDDTGMGSGIIWQSDNVVYGISGTIGISEAEKLANGFE